MTSLTETAWPASSIPSAIASPEAYLFDAAARGDGHDSDSELFEVVFVVVVVVVVFVMVVAVFVIAVFVVIAIVAVFVIAVFVVIAIVALFVVVVVAFVPSVVVLTHTGNTVIEHKKSGQRERTARGLVDDRIGSGHLSKPAAVIELR